MSSDHGLVTMPFGDGVYAFRLGIGEWRELQEKCNCGPQELFERILLRRWKVDDLREAIRLGLIGGGTSPVEALKLVARYVDKRPLLETVPLACDVIAASLKGPAEEQPPGEAPVAGEPATGKSPLPPSTGTEPPPDSPQPK